MEAKANFPTSSSELRSTDTELAHLRNMIAMAVRHREAAFPLNYRRVRVTSILATSHLLPAQLRVASALLAQIDSVTTTRP
ncbi:hypothetical protein BTHE68_72280 (plasmid) [Burkholderia sp. THE68]|uniref:hypothetical protein n=1 Tax=Burkholderia sp. THE68 TaxID=758782 RepID=UPI0013196869|nr:hypothetical protein [Burkholderia sp. THE68]BBU33494.1 hypothetical protein BTHE68_72280 [Burkholderia sp. THE68]